MLKSQKVRLKKIKQLQKIINCVLKNFSGKKSKNCLLKNLKIVC